MAARTITTVNMLDSARAASPGVQVLTFDFNSGATKFGTVSDVALLGKIPQPCTIVGGVIYGGARNTTDPAHFLLTAVHPDDFTKSGGTIVFGSGTGSFTTSAGGVNSAQVGKLSRISLSADATVSHAVLYLNCMTGTTESVSQSLHGAILYVCDGRDF
jgi:hypothetical protein